MHTHTYGGGERERERQYLIRSGKGLLNRTVFAQQLISGSHEAKSFCNQVRRNPLMRKESLPTTCLTEHYYPEYVKNSKNRKSN